MMQVVFLYPAVALAPVIGLTGSVIAHVAISRLAGNDRPIMRFSQSAPIGAVFTAAVSVISMVMQRNCSLDALVLMLFNQVCYAALVYGYGSFVSLNITSLRFRLLREIAHAPKGLSAEEILERYNGREILDKRIGRLKEGRHLIEKDGRYFVGNRIIVRVFNLVEIMKRLIIGRGNRLIREV